jgi:hypothetical protein
MGDAPTSGVRRPADVLRACCLSVWVVLGGLAALLFGQYHAGVLHPAYIPFLALVAIAASLIVAVVVIVVGRLVRGQRRWNAVLWFMVAAFPVGLILFPLLYTRHEWAKRVGPVGMRAHLAVMVGGSLMEAQAAWFYPKRKESERLVMYYRELDDADGDLEAMDRHVAELEQTLGIRLREKIHWVRGSLVGQGRVSVLGLSLGSEKSPAGSVDRHELAHAVLAEVRIPAADPPALLNEGWADSHMGLSSGALAGRALEEKRREDAIDLAEFFSVYLYRSDTGQAYTYGGAFVDFLLRKYSIGQFVKICNQWTVETSEQDFQEVYGLSVSQLEEAFWRDAEVVTRGYE